MALKPIRIEDVEGDPQADLCARTGRPLYLHWFERPFTYDRIDHPDQVVEVG
jgi:hypothetical protein